MHKGKVPVCQSQCPLERGSKSKNAAPDPSVMATQTEPTQIQVAKERKKEGESNSERKSSFK